MIWDINLEQVASLASCGRAEGSHGTECAPEVNVGQQRTWSQQQSGRLRKKKSVTEYLVLHSINVYFLISLFLKYDILGPHVQKRA